MARRRAIAALGATIFALVVLPQRALGDLPVHCLHSQILGQWTFRVGRAHGTANREGGAFERCSSATDGFSEGDFGIRGRPAFKPIETIQVHLSHPNQARATIRGKEETGSWTMVYDEGFEVTLGSLRFFAFSHFEPNAGMNEKGEEALKTKTLASKCEQTLPGWSH